MDRMLQVQNGEIYQDDGQGLILYQQKRGGKAYWSHSGSEKGVAINMLFDPATGDGMVYFVNMDIGDGFFPGMEELTVDLFESLNRTH